MGTVNSLFERIPNGSEDPLKVPGGSIESREFRKEVAHANRSGDCIINLGSGYYRPVPFEDDKDVEMYLASELHRARAILYKRAKMKESYNRRRIECLTKAGTK